jgi:hypothetical protein
VESPEAVLSVGDGVRVKVIDVDVSRRRVSLSMRQVGGQVAPVSEGEIEVERPEPPRSPEPPQRPEPPRGPEPEAAAPTEPTPEAQQAAEPAVGDAEPDETHEPQSPEPQPPEPAPAAPEASPEPTAPAAPEEAEGEVSLESILRDLKRREGRTD